MSRTGFPLIGQDIKSALRALMAARTYLIASVLTLALGTGSNATVFSITNGIMLNVLPWKNAERLVLLAEVQRGRGTSEEDGVVYARYEEWKARQRSFEALVAMRMRPFVLGGRSPDTWTGAEVSGEVFDCLGLGLELGRGITLADEEAESNVAVLSYRAWSERFERSPGIIGETLEIDGKPVRIIGVLRSDQWFPIPSSYLLMPLRKEGLGQERIQAMGLLRRGVSGERARQELVEINERAIREGREGRSRVDIAVHRADAFVVGGASRRAVVLLMIAVGAILLSSCANVGSLTFSHTASLQASLTVRAVLGASRGYLIRLMLLQHTFLALVSLPVSAFLAQLTLHWILDRLPTSVSWMDQVFRFDLWVWAFLVSVTLGTVIVFGLFPAIAASRIDLVHLLRREAGLGIVGRPPRRSGAGLTMLQVALGIAFFTSARLSATSFEAIMARDIGFDLDNLLVGALVLPEARYRTDLEIVRGQRQVIEMVEKVPGILFAGVSDSTLTSPTVLSRRLELWGAPGTGPRTETVSWAAVTPGYLRAAGLPLKRGRAIDDGDVKGTPAVAMVNETAMRELFNGSDPVGRHFRVESEDWEVVGVLGDVQRFGGPRRFFPEVYVPFAQQPASRIQLFARTTVEPVSVVGKVRSGILAQDAWIPVRLLTSARRIMSDVLFPLRLFGDMMNLLGLISLGLAISGSYSLVRQLMQQRGSELAVRSAVGAEPLGLCLELMMPLLRRIGFGMAGGMLLAVAIGSILKSQGILAPDVDALPLGAIVGSALGVGSASVIGSILPAIQLARRSPAEILGAREVKG